MTVILTPDLCSGYLFPVLAQTVPLTQETAAASLVIHSKHRSELDHSGTYTNHRLAATGVSVCVCVSVCLCLCVCVYVIIFGTDLNTASVKVRHIKQLMIITRDTNKTTNCSRVQLGPAEARYTGELLQVYLV